MARPRIVIPDDLEEYLEERKATTDRFTTNGDVIRYLIGRGRDAEQLEEEVRNELSEIRMELNEINERLDQVQTEVETSAWERWFGG